LYRLRVKEVARSLGYNQAQLSRKAGLDYKTVQKLFRDPYHNVEFHVLVRIAEGLDIPLSDLYEKEPD